MSNRVRKAPGTKGSLKWVQVMVNAHPHLLSAAVGASIGIPAGEIEWLSPLSADAYAEYMDQGFLDRLGVTLDYYPLKAFWPASGPRWDALGCAGDQVILIEAKAYLRELMSTPCQAKPASLERIRASLGLVKASFDVTPDVDWAGRYYQYANRLAHLYLLRQLNHIPAELVHLCFLNDREQNGPTTAAQWHVAISKAHTALGIIDHPLLRHVHHVFVDVAGLVEADQRRPAPLVHGTDSSCQPPTSTAQSRFI
jgi:hypothetical protein